MAGITFLKEKGKINIYRTFSYRDSDNKPQNHRKLIGEYDKKNNKAIFNTYFLILIAQQGISLDQIESIPIRQIPKIVDFGQYTKEDFLNKSITALDREKVIEGSFKPSNTADSGLISYLIRNISLIGVNRNNNLFKESNISCQNLGSYLLLTNIVKDLQLLDILKEIFPEKWEEILTISYYLAINNSNLIYCHQWAENTKTYLNKVALQPQNIADLLKYIDNRKCMQFFEKWSDICNDDDYLALEITSKSTYSRLITKYEVEYNKDRENLKQVTICIVYGENSGLPIYISPYSESINNVKSLISFIDQFEFFSDKIQKLIFGKNFYSKDAIKTLIEEYPNYKFLLAVPSTTNIAKQIISSGMDKFNNKYTFQDGNDILEGYSFIEAFDDSNQLEYHVFFNKQLYQEKEKELLDKILDLKIEAEQNPVKYSEIGAFVNYLLFKKDTVTNNFTVQINTTKIKKESNYISWFIIVTNEIGLNSIDVLNDYRRKFDVEKDFYRVKDNLDIKELSNRGSNIIGGKLLISLIALILNSYINNIIKDNEILNKFTIEELIREIDKIKILEFDGKTVITQISKLNRYILESFGYQIKESNI
jgi:transposase